MMFGKQLIRDNDAFMKNVLILKIELEKIFIEDLREQNKVIRARQKVFQLFNFDPFVEQIHLVKGAIKKNGGIHEFYKEFKPP